VNSPVPLHDSGPADHRLLGRLLDAGTLVLDARDAPRFASATACALFGADDEAVLRGTWPSLAAQLRVADWPRELGEGEAFHGRADIATARGPRALRYELHVIDAARGDRALLVRDRAALSATDGVLLLAAEAAANRHVLTGLVHAAKGPLNNFNLTLSLLAGNLARTDTANAEAAAKRARYLAVLQSEAARLAAYVDEINALTRAARPSREVVDVAELSQHCARVLRHDATMREMRFDVDVPGHPVHATGDAHLLRLALLSFAICVIELTEAGGDVGLRIEQRRDAVCVTLTTSRPRLPRTLVEGLFRISRTAASAHTAAIAARTIVEAQGGEVVVHDDNGGRAGFSIVFPANG
jgi:signal transduction histidine kinase